MMMKESAVEAVNRYGETRVLVHVAKDNIHGHPTTGFYSEWRK